MSAQPRIVAYDLDGRPVDPKQAAQAAWEAQPQPGTSRRNLKRFQIARERRERKKEIRAMMRQLLGHVWEEDE